MIAAQVPELADGGYWYVVEADTASGAGFGLNAGAAWYGLVSGVLYAAVRTVQPVTGMETTNTVTVDAVLSAAQIADKPHARLGGL